MKLFLLTITMLFSFSVFSKEFKCAKHGQYGFPADIATEKALTLYDNRTCPTEKDITKGKDSRRKLMRAIVAKGHKLVYVPQNAISTKNFDARTKDRNSKEATLANQL